MTEERRRSTDVALELMAEQIRRIGGRLDSIDGNLKAQSNYVMEFTQRFEGIERKITSITGAFPVCAAGGIPTEQHRVEHVEMRDERKAQKVRRRQVTTALIISLVLGGAATIGTGMIFYFKYGVIDARATK